jgi:hypothetical protein
MTFHAMNEHQQPNSSVIAISCLFWKKNWQKKSGKKKQEKKMQIA